jgi:hypothetical protein
MAEVLKDPEVEAALDSLRLGGSAPRVSCDANKDHRARRNSNFPDELVDSAAQRPFGRTYEAVPEQHAAFGHGLVDPSLSRRCSRRADAELDQRG